MNERQKREYDGLIVSGHAPHCDCIYCRNRSEDYDPLIFRDVCPNCLGRGLTIEDRTCELCEGTGKL